jgi:hypothetical protein
MAGVVTGPLLLVSVPFLTALALAALRSGERAERIDRWVVTLAVPIAIGLAAWSGGLDRLGLLTAGLVWATAVLARWGNRLSPRAPTTQDEDAPASALPPLHTAPALDQVALDQVVLAGLLMICLLSGGSHGVAVWAAVVVVAGATMLRGGPGNGGAIVATGLVLLLFGTITAPLDPLLGLGCQVIGLGALLTLVPALLPVALPLLLRPGTETAGPLLLAAGLAGLALAAIAARTLTAERGAVLGQIGLAAAAIGLGTQDSAFAALILLVLLTLSDAATRLSDRARPVALLGLAGIPPLGTFAGLALVLPAIAAHASWMLLICLPAIALFGWRLIRQASTRRATAGHTAALGKAAERQAPGNGHMGSHAPEAERSPAANGARETGAVFAPALGWLPVATALAIGLLTPTPVATWLRSALPPAPVAQHPARVSPPVPSQAPTPAPTPAGPLAHPLGPAR